MQEFNKKAQAIKLAIFDVDGVLTDGKLYYSKTAMELKSFHVHDGLGLKLLHKSGLEIAIITACRSGIIGRRAQDLGLRYVYQDCENKLKVYEELKQELKLEDREIAYMGDDLIDLPIMSRVGLSLTVANAPQLVQDRVNYITRAAGGQGAVREVCELLMQAQGTYLTVLEPYLQTEVTS